MRIEAPAMPSAPARPVDPEATPWWRVGMVWLVWGGPAVVVVAALATGVIAYRGADEVLSQAPTAREAPRQLGPGLPAMLGRNHAATPAATSATPPTNPPTNPTAPAPAVPAAPR